MTQNVGGTSKGAVECTRFGFRSHDGEGGFTCWIESCLWGCGSFTSRMTFGNTNTVLDGTIEICDIKNGNLDIKDGSGDNKEGARDIDDGILVVKDGTVANKRRSQYIKNGFPDMEVAVLKCSRLKTE